MFLLACIPICIKYFRKGVVPIYMCIKKYKDGIGLLELLFSTSEGWVTLCLFWRLEFHLLAARGVIKSRLCRDSNCKLLWDCDIQMIRNLCSGILRWTGHHTWPSVGNQNKKVKGKIILTEKKYYQTQGYFFKFYKYDWGPQKPSFICKNWTTNSASYFSFSLVNTSIYLKWVTSVSHRGKLSNSLKTSLSLNK